MLGHSPPRPVFLHSGYSRKCSTSCISIVPVDVSFNALVARLSVTRTLCLLVGEQYKRNMQFQSSISKPYPKEVLCHRSHGFSVIPILNLSQPLTRASIKSIAEVRHLSKSVKSQLIRKSALNQCSQSIVSRTAFTELRKLGSRDQCLMYGLLSPWL